MIDLDPKNEKLRDRAVRIASELSGADSSVSQAALESEGWVLKKALRRLGANGSA
jgi:N-acetylmuramic acid 6-phosphate (MurNAc-6-P) etherase